MGEGFDFADVRCLQVNLPPLQLTRSTLVGTLQPVLPSVQTLHLTGVPYRLLYECMDSLAEAIGL